MDPRTVTVAAVMLAAFAAIGPGRAAQPGDEALSVTGTGRIALSLDGRGYLGEIESGRLRLGLRWPGVEGTEFLGSGGLLMRFVAGEKGETVLLGPGDFESALSGSGIAGASEGCRGGKRYPSDGCDDDGDGAVDEDPLDGRDNDEDGAVDEDFAAVGDGMYVTSAVDPTYGIRVTRATRIWNYGHVRDFVGFRTIVEYMPPGGREKVLRKFELISYIDFDIGERDDAGRGRNDRAFFIQAAPGNDGRQGPAYAVASDAEMGAPLAAVVIFGASGPGGPVAVEAQARIRPSNADSLFVAATQARAVLGGDPSMIDTGGAQRFLGADGTDFIATGAKAGDIVITHRLTPPRDLCPGDRVEIEWAIVFGKDLQALTRNISRARETWEGLTLPGGARLRWVVPARRAVRIEAAAALAPVWVQGEKRPAVSIDLPPVEGEEIEWIKVAGELTGDFETVGGRLVIALDGDAATAEPFVVEGQLTDGTIFTSWIGEEELQRYAGDEDLLPGRLPEDSIKLFPNPFAGALTIEILVHEPAGSAQERPAPVQPGISSVKVYDVKGRLVRTILSDEVLHPGNHTLGWDGTDEAGTEVAAGVYYCRLQIGERSLTQRVILLR